MNYYNVKLKHFILLVILGHNFFSYGMLEGPAKPETEHGSREHEQYLKELVKNAFTIIYKGNVTELQDFLSPISHENIDQLLRAKIKLNIQKDTPEYFLFGEKESIQVTLLGYLFYINLFKKPRPYTMFKYLVESSSSPFNAYTEVSGATYTPLLFLLKYDWALDKSHIYAGNKCKVDLQLLNLLLKNGAAITPEVEEFAKRGCKRRPEVVGFTSNLNEVQKIIEDQKVLREQARTNPNLELLKQAILEDNSYVVYLALTQGKLDIHPEDVAELQDKYKDTRIERILHKYFVSKEEGNSTLPSFTFTSSRLLP